MGLALNEKSSFSISYDHSSLNEDSVYTNAPIFRRDDPAVGTDDVAEKPAPPACR